MNAIVARALNKTFGHGKKKQPVAAVRDLNLTVEKGERVAFIGPNGAGKSTSIKMFTGILQPTSGELRVLDLIPSSQRKRLVCKIGVLFGQRSQLMQELSARRGLQYLGAVFSLERNIVNKRIEEVAALLNATDLLDQPVRSLSLGQRMRCELAAVLMHEPEMLFLDEPTIGLDIEAKRVFRELVSRLNADEGTTIFLTSHDTADIEAVAERVIVINHGQLIYDNNVDVMRRTLLSTKRIELHLERPLTAAAFSGFRLENPSPLSVVIHLDTATHDLRGVIAKAFETEAVIDVSITSPPLEELITEIYNRNAP